MRKRKREGNINIDIGLIVEWNCVIILYFIIFIIFKGEIVCNFSFICFDF